MKMFYEWIPEKQQDENTKNSRSSKYFVKKHFKSSIRLLFVPHHSQEISRQLLI